MGYIGQRLPGRNNMRLARGEGLFTADVQLPRQCFMALVRSPYAHAEIEGIDLSAARALPGVIATATAADLAKSTRPLSFARPPEVELNLADMEGKRLRQHALAEKWVGFSGCPVAAIVAEDASTAAEAAERVEVEYRELPPVADAEAALAPGSTVAIPGWNDNLVFHTRYANGDADAQLKAAPATVSGRVEVQRHVPVPLEPRAFVADYSARTGRLTMHASTQMPHTDRTLLAATLGMASDDVQVIQPDVGGGFGCKVPGSDEEILVAYFARRLERPVRWTEERTEYFLACGHARETFFDFEASYAEDGKLLALKIDAVADVGLPFGAWVQSCVTAYCLPCGYAVDHCEVNIRSVVTNKCKWGGYRGFGKEAASFCMERIMDRIADAAGIDRAAVRLRNFIAPDAFPYGQVSGALLDSGNYQGALTKLLELAEPESFRKEQAAAKAEGRHIGLGIGFELTPEGCSMPNSDFLQGWDGATVRMDPSGRVTVLTGVTSPGSGNETGIAMIVADALGVPLDKVSVIQGDTDRCPYGLGNFSSRSLMIGGSAALAAAQELREKLLNVAAKMLDAEPQRLEMADGEVRVAASAGEGADGAPRNPGGPPWSVPVARVARTIYRHAFGPETEGVEPGLESTRYFRIGNVHHQPDRDGRLSFYPTWPFMAVAVVVEVDPETGFVDVLRCSAVHDCGTVVNPTLVEGNAHGGIAQGLGAALYEELLHDGAGQLLTTTLMDYTLPTAVEMPAEVNMAHQETPTPATPLGTKGAGESGVAGPMAAVASAVEDALGLDGLALMALPLKPERVWRSIREAAAAP